MQGESGPKMGQMAKRASTKDVRSLHTFPPPNGRGASDQMAPLGSARSVYRAKRWQGGIVTIQPFDLTAPSPNVTTGLVA